MQTSFQRFLKDVLKDAGISEEGANLSGLDDPTEYQKIMIDMAKEIHGLKETKRQKKEKDDKKRKEILTHENDYLLQQRKVSDPALYLPAKRKTNKGFEIENGSDEGSGSNNDEESYGSNNGESSESEGDEKNTAHRKSATTPRASQSQNKKNPSSAVSAITNKSKTSNSFMSMMIDLTREDPELIQAEIEDKKQKRFHDEEEHKQRMELNERRFSLEERQLAAEEKRLQNDAKRLEIEERRLAVMELESEIKRNESNLFKHLLQQQLNE